MFVEFAYMVASGVEGHQHRPHKAFWMGVFFTLTVQCLSAMRFSVGIFEEPCNGRNLVMQITKKFHAFDDKADSARVPMFDLIG